MENDTQPVAFSNLALPEPILRAVDALGYENATPVQAECIPHMLQGRDVLGQAQTGTGKTAAFALPLLSRIDLSKSDPQVLVLAPTRELALQVSEALQTYARHMPGFHVLPVYGGQGMGLQLRQLRRGTHVIVGTPGRVMDHLRRGSLNLGGLNTLVLDEADEMLNMGFIDDIEWILDQTPSERQVALFSATMPSVIRRVANKYLSDPVHIKVASKTVTGSTINQRHCVVTPAHKLDVLTRLMEVEEFDAMLIFVRTRTMTVELAEKLTAHGVSAEALNGDMSQDVRERAVNGLKRGRLDVVVATDVAARGLDVDRISHVVNYDIPNNPESYVHRIGRTGRAGRTGNALLFVHPRERYQLKAIERATGQRIPPIDLPSADALSQHRIASFVERLREVLSNQDMDYYYRLVAEIEKEHEISLLDLAASMAFLSQGEKPFRVSELKMGRPGGKQDNARGGRPYERGDRGRRGERNDRGSRDQRGAREQPYGRQQRDGGAYGGQQRGGARAEQAQDRRWQKRGDKNDSRANGGSGQGGDGYQPPRRQQRTDQPERPNSGDGREWSGRSDRSAQSARPARPAQPDRSDRSDRLDRSGQPDKSGRPEWSERSDRPDRSDRSARSFQRDLEGGEGGNTHHQQRSDHPPRQDSPPPRRDSRQRGSAPRTQPYRLAVGYDHGVAPGEIVGAIANELGMDGRHIGRIDIHDRYTVVGLPEGMPPEMFKHLRRVHVRGQALRARLWDEATGAPAGFGGTAASGADARGNADSEGHERPKRKKSKKLKKTMAAKKKKAARRG